MAPISSPVKHLYEFGPFRLDTVERTLLRDGHPLSLTPKAYEVLLALVRRSGHIVEKDELMKEVWADAFVEEGNLTHHVFTLRKILGEGNTDEYIETIPRRGYRFVASVQEVQDEGVDGADNQTRHAAPPADETLAARPSGIENLSVGYKKSAILIIVLLGVTLTGIYLYRYFHRGVSESPSTLDSQGMTVRKLTSNSRATTATISPDGKYVVHSQEDAGRQSLWLKQVATLSEVQIVSPTEVTYFGGAFTSDGSYLYYVIEEKNRSSGVYQIPLVGGTPRKILKNIASPITLSPDEKRFAFVRVHQDETSLWIANVDGSGERKLATRKGSERFDYGVGVGPAWSPNGKILACSVGGVEAGREYHTVIGINAEGGEEELITPQRWVEGGQVAWRRDGSGMLLVADEQVWQISYPGGEPLKITNDANNYIGISLTADSRAMVTLQNDIQSSIWIGPSSDVGSGHPVTSGYFEGFQGLSWTPDGKLVYSSRASGNLDLWLMASDGTNRKQLTANAGSNYAPSVSPDGRYVVFTSTRSGTTHIWRSKIDGSEAQQLTKGTEERWPECSPDGRWVVYVSFGASTPQNLWKVPLNGGDSAPVTGIPSNVPAFSPDGKLIAFRGRNAADEPVKIIVMSFGDGVIMKAFDIEPTTIMVGDYKVLRWTPDGRGLAYIDTRTGVANIWVRPLDGGPERQLTAFKSEQIFKFNWSFDGKQLAVTRGAMIKDVILISRFT